jgi:hypothetical protein
MLLSPRFRHHDPIIIHIIYESIDDTVLQSNRFTKAALLYYATNLCER